MGREIVIEFFRASFVPQAVTAEFGDEIVFQWLRGEHRLASGAGPDDPSAGELFDVDLDEASPEFRFRVDARVLEGFSFFDRENPAQIGFVEVSSGEREVRVGVVDNEFIPPIMYIFAGDSIRWEHEFMEDFHTVTSGRSSAEEDNPGALFDEISDCDHPIFVYQFEEPRSYPYFCRPHEEMGMVGVIHVQRTFLRGDASGDEVLNLTDAIAALGVLFLGGSDRDCPDALDSNDDGELNITDPVYLLSFLFLGGPPPPAPFPLVGGDRTDDPLLCGELEE